MRCYECHARNPPFGAVVIVSDVRSAHIHADRQQLEVPPVLLVRSIDKGTLSKLAVHLSVGLARVHSLVHPQRFSSEARRLHTLPAVPAADLPQKDG